MSDPADLSNIDKHRRFPITAVTPRTLPIPHTVEGHRVVAYTTRYRLLEPDTTILWLEVPTLPSSTKQPDVDFTFTANIEFVGALANPPIRLLRPHEPVTFTLDKILGFIRGRVLCDLAPFIGPVSRFLLAMPVGV